MSRARVQRPLVIAHRGASGELPEHTLEAYQLAIDQGADYIEPDLVATRDGVLVARHENEVSATTDVADRPELADRRRSKTIEGVTVDGWFTEDLTAAEIATLRVRERLPELRGTRFDGQFRVPTWEQILALVAANNERQGRRGADRIGVYPETKHPSYFAACGLSLEPPLLAALAPHNWLDAAAPVFIQSFEVGNLLALRRCCDVPLIQLLAEGAPWDWQVSGETRGYREMATAPGLAEVASYATGVGVAKSLVLPRTPAGRLSEETGLVADAHRQGLLIHAWTFRAENTFLPLEYRRPGPPEVLGDLAAEIDRFLAAGIDGLFVDHPGIGVAARNCFIARDR